MASAGDVDPELDTLLDEAFADLPVAAQVAEEGTSAQSNAASQSSGAASAPKGLPALPGHRRHRASGATRSVSAVFDPLSFKGRASRSGTAGAGPSTCSESNTNGGGDGPLLRQMAALFSDIAAGQPEPASSAAPSRGDTQSAPRVGAGSFGSTLQHLQSAALRASHAAGSDESGEAAAFAGMMDALAQGMGGMGGAEGGGEGDMMEGIMRLLLSKDVLYDPMKEISQLFHPWLQQHAEQLSAEEQARYPRQLVLIDEICDLLEKHGNSRFDDLLQALQQLQSLGQPPQEIVDQLSPGSGLPAFGGTAIPSPYT